MWRPYWRLLAMLLIVAAATGCLFGGDDDDDDADTPTVPAVVSVVPADDAIHVEPWDEIQVEFNVLMDEASVVATTTLSDPTRGEVAFSTLWLGRVLTIDPEDELDRGVVYTLTIGASAESAEGEPMAAAFTSSFTTLPNYPVVLFTSPADGATGVAINTSVYIEFSMAMDYTSTLAAISVDPAVAYTPDFENDDITLDFAANLAASTTYTVTVDASAAAWGPGATLGEDYIFSFTTGSGVDNTPPTIVSYSPVNGATNVSVDVGELVITFSEPIQGVDEPEAMDLRFYACIYSQPELDASGTVLTVPLLRLPAGCTLFIDLGPFQDLVGNWSADPPVYSITTAGTADFFPAGPNDWWEYMQVGDSWENPYLIKAENVGGGDFDLSRYRLPEPGRQPDDYTVLDQISHYTRTASSVYWDGRNELNDGDVWEAFTFTPPVEWLQFPLTEGLDWEGDATFSMGDSQARVNYSIEVTDVLDVAPDLLRPTPRAGWQLAGDRQGSWFFPDCAEVTLTFRLEAYTEGSWEIMEEGSEVNYYCPGLGLIMMHSEGTSYGEGEPELHEDHAYLSWWLVGQ